MACMALNRHYIIALSTFTATKLNRPRLKGRINPSTVLMSCHGWICCRALLLDIELNELKINIIYMKSFTFHYH